MRFIHSHDSGSCIHYNYRSVSKGLGFQTYPENSSPPPPPARDLTRSALGTARSALGYFYRMSSNSCYGKTFFLVCQLNLYRGQVNALSVRGGGGGTSWDFPSVVRQRVWLVGCLFLCLFVCLSVCFAFFFVISSINLQPLSYLSYRMPIRVFNYKEFFYRAARITMPDCPPPPSPLSRWASFAALAVEENIRALNPPPQKKKKKKKKCFRALYE